MFDKNSRYANLTPYILSDARGRQVEITPFAAAPKQTFSGIHILRDGERLDHLSSFYLSNTTGYWRIAEMNDAMTADVLLQRRLIEIPEKTLGTN